MAFAGPGLVLEAGQEKEFSLRRSYNIKCAKVALCLTDPEGSELLKQTLDWSIGPISSVTSESLEVSVAPSRIFLKDLKHGTFWISERLHGRYVIKVTNKGIGAVNLGTLKLSFTERANGYNVSKKGVPIPLPNSEDYLLAENGTYSFHLEVNSTQNLLQDAIDQYKQGNKKLILTLCLEKQGKNIA